MKASSLFLSIVIIFTFCFFSTAAQTKDTAVAQTKAVKKVAKPAWGLNLTKAEFDSLQKNYAAFENSEEVGNLTWGQLREILSLYHDQVLRDGDRRYVNMPGIYRKQVTKSIAAKLDTAINTVNAVATSLTNANEDINDVAHFVRGLDESVARIQLVVTQDKTPLTTVGSVTKTMPASEVAMELIKKEVAVRRAAAMTPFDSPKKK